MKKFIFVVLLVSMLAMAVAVPAFAEKAKDTCLISKPCLTLNPELSSVQRYTDERAANRATVRQADALILAANPELKFVRYALAVTKAKAAFWAANPEVSTARHVMAAKAANRVAERQSLFLGLRTPS